MSENKEVPKGWGYVLLGDIFVIERGGSPRPIDDFITDAEDGVNWIKIGDTKGITKYIFKTQEKIKPEGIKNSRMVYEDDFILSNSMSFGRPYIMKTTGCIHDGWLVIRTNKEIINTSYLYHSLSSSSVFQQFVRLAKGSTVKNLNIEAVKRVSIHLPPLPEQHRIVAKIEELFSSLDKGIESLKTTRQQLKVYRQAVLKWAFEGKLTNKNVVDGELPNGWTRVNLKEVVDKISDGPFGSNLKTADYVDQGVRVIRLENIGYMEFKNEFQSFITENKYETIKKHTVTKGDIILSSFVSENIRTAILPDFIDKAINKADCFLVRPYEGKVCNRYLFFYFSTREMYQQLIGEVHGATRPRVNTTQLKLSQIPITSLPEQRRIVAEIEYRLSVCDKIEETIEQSLKQAEFLRQSILKKAFEGKLIPQDPNDEPAGVLLERIKAERENNKLKTTQVSRKSKIGTRKATS